MSLISNICLCNFPAAHFHDLLLACTVFFSADPAFILTFATSFSKAIYVIIIIILCMKNCLATSAPDWGICCYCLINMKCSLAQSFLASLKMWNLTDFLSVGFPPPSHLLDFRILIPPLFPLPHISPISDNLHNCHVDLASHIKAAYFYWWP